VLTDPYTAKSGLTPPRLKPDIVTVSHEAGDEITRRGAPADTLNVDAPGEYEYRGVFLWGMETRTATSQRNLVFLIQIDDLNVAHLGDLGHELTDAQLERLSRVDVLLVPVGGSPALTASAARRVVSQIEPKVVIPMHYRIPGLRGSAAPLAEFQKEFGVKNVQEQETYRVRSRDLTGEEMLTIVLRRP
ncbi:MAG: MBL fold metallo-hydrolase, partial [Candidatus Kerfeldbacteria bacterium]|nr:MBL fold metallo-hydrolase [Candidatus Kerfeldbacteria bacterium]